MCVVSNIGDDYRRGIPEKFPWWPNQPWEVIPSTAPSREEFDRLKKEVEEMKKKLKKGKQQDIKEGNADCEMSDKVKILRDIAKFVGIDLEDVFDPNNQSGPKS